MITFGISIPVVFRNKRNHQLSIDNQVEKANAVPEEIPKIPRTVTKRDRVYNPMEPARVPIRKVPAIPIIPASRSAPGNQSSGRQKTMTPSVGGVEATGFVRDIYTRIFNTMELDTLDDKLYKAFRAGRSTMESLPMGPFAVVSPTAGHIDCRVGGSSEMVPFPYKSMNPVQQEYMTKVIHCMSSDNGQDILICAPTGSGKTEGVIYSVVHSINMLRRANLIGKTVINYYSRTHHQLRQVVRRLGNQDIYDLRITEIGARERLCNLYYRRNTSKIKDIVGDSTLEQAMSNPSLLVNACNKCRDYYHKENLRNKAYLSNVDLEMTCPFYRNYAHCNEEYFRELMGTSSEGKSGVYMDIEEIIDCVGIMRSDPCWYFVQSHLISKHNFNFFVQPYNYLDKVIWHGSKQTSYVNVIDEAHNLPSFLRGIQSATLRLDDIIDVRTMLAKFGDNKRTFIKNNVGERDHRYTVSNPYTGIVMVPRYRKTHTHDDRVISGIATNLTYISSLFTARLVKILHELNLTCKDGSKWEVNKHMNNYSTIQIGDPLVIERDFSTNADFVPLKTLGDDATVLWKQWEDSENFPSDPVQRRLVRAVMNIRRFLPDTDGQSHYIVTFVSTRPTDNLESQSLMSMVEEFFALDRWEMNLTACDSTLIYRKLHAHSDTNILLSGTYDHKGVAIMEIFGLFPFTSIITSNHVFDPKKCMHTVYGFYHPECRDCELVEGNAQIRWTYSERNKKIPGGKKPRTLVEIMISSACEVIRDLVGASKRNIIVFMPSKKLAYDLQRGIIGCSIPICDTVAYEESSSSRYCLLDVDEIHGTDGRLDVYMEKYFQVGERPEKSAIVVTWFRSIFSEGIDFPDGTVSAILICGLPWANKNSLEISSRQAFLMNNLMDVDYTSVDRMLYESEMRNTINQTIGRLARSVRSRGLVLIHDASYGAKYFPSWSLSNENVRENREYPSDGVSFDKRRIDVLTWRGQYPMLIRNFRKIQGNV
jgi:Rad3-related DNA helicase